MNPIDTSNLASGLIPGGGTSGIGGARGDLGKDQFLQLLATQMQQQNPLEPMENSDFLAQLAQFSALEQQTQIGDRLGEMLTLDRLTTTSHLLGRTVEYLDLASGEIREGTVGGVRLVEGQVQLEIGDEPVSLGQVLEVA